MDSEESEMLEEASDAKRTAEDFQQLYEEVSKEVQAAEGRTPTTDELATAAIRSGFKLEVLKYCFGLRVTLEGLFNELMEAAVESGNLEMVKCVVEHQAKRIDERADLVAHRNWQQWERVAFLNERDASTAIRLGYYHILNYLHEIKKKCHCHRRWSTHRVRDDDGDWESVDWFWPAVLNGDVQGLAWLYDNGYRVLFTKGWNKIRHCDAESIPECLGERGHLDALKWWRSHNFPWDEGTIVMAAFYGHHEVMKWLAENGCPFTEMTHIAATLSEDKHCLGLANHLRMDTLPYSRLPADSIFEWDERDDDEVQELKKFLSMHSQEAFRDGYKKAWLPISSDAATGFTTFKVLSRYVHDEGRGRPTKEPLNAEDWKDFKKKWNINALRCFIHHIRKYSDTDRTNIADPEEARHIHEYRNCPCFYWVDTGSCKKPKITEQLGMK